MEFSPWNECVTIIARELGVNVTVNNLQHIIQNGGSHDELMTRLVDHIGLKCKKLDEKLERIPSLLFPVFVPLKDNQAVVVFSINENKTATVSFNISPDIKTQIDLEKLESLRDGELWLVYNKERAKDKRIDDFLKPYKENWLLQLISKDARFYGQIALGALFGNILALSSALFSMQVYDRVIPAQSYSTLWVLFIGVTVALLMDMGLRLARSHLADAIGKKTDMFMSGMFFSRALRIKNDARPNSTGAFVAQLREIEHIRELLTSTTVIAMVDMPFIILFIGVIAFIGGELAFAPLLAIPLIVIPGLIAQWPLSRLSQQGIRESAIRNSMLVETVEGLEDIKIMQAEDRFLRTWNECNTTTAQISLEQRHWASLITNWCQFVQQLVYISVIAIGVYLVINNDITTGTLIACSILSSRTVAPLGQLAQVLTRWQHAKMAKTGLDEFLKKPLDQKPFDETLHTDSIKGNFSLRDVKYRFNQESPMVLNINSLKITPGEKIAILGSIGAGKSTLLRLVSGIAEATEGELLLDGLVMKDISNNDIRRDVAYLPQGAQLFHGTIRENLILGKPQTSIEQIVEVLNIAGAASLLKTGKGLDLSIAEGGRGLSGGQKQTLLLARTLLRNSPILFLDEPTANMDEKLENHVVNALGSHIKDKTFIIVTHRQAPLKLVDRIIVMSQGSIVLDGPRDQVLQRLKSSN
ncbi:type I secretion system permease/ATPase [Pragia fontium]|uniref:ATP-binding cassette, subfamily C, LapB n=2 Tax=Pragia fontium TaxID=82985 RepID=A0AAJ4WBD3_9GAMM|nr:type I secretion system permease/ATPase [Pragia fontium]GKX61790.1 ABC transporter ATP-binding protein [Pragia fontium]SFC99335.1 ATP-binding cassette, subfamily C, LapB [Pragia fontium DSM 5563 = ATCC 49100]SUB82412.1 RTX-I toxin determinant B [Pragia fontium]VEJ55314.1 RTX-I toxin determinant B [Pragia fontium]